MLQSLIQNSTSLIKSQLSGNRQIIGEILAIKEKRGRSQRQSAAQSIFSSENKIFKEPDFKLALNLGEKTAFLSRELKKGRKSYRVRQSFKKDLHSCAKQKSSRTIELHTSLNPENPLRIDANSSGNPAGKVIHSRRNQKCPISGKDPRIHRERVSDSWRTSKTISEDPKVVNLVFYKNSLQELGGPKTARIAHRKKFSLKLERKTAGDKNRARLIAPKQNEAALNQCRPWSPLALDRGDAESPDMQSKYSSLNL